MIRNQWYPENHAITIDNKRKVITVPADGLAPLGARTSAGEVIITFRPALEGITEFSYASRDWARVVSS